MGGGFAIMAGYGLLGDGGMLLVMAGVFDLTIGVICVVGLPRHLGVPLMGLLLDETATT